MGLVVHMDTLNGAIDDVLEKLGIDMEGQPFAVPVGGLNVLARAVDNGRGVAVFASPPPEHEGAVDRAGYEVLQKSIPILTKGYGFEHVTIYR